MGDLIYTTQQLKKIEKILSKNDATVCPIIFGSVNISRWNVSLSVISYHTVQQRQKQQQNQQSSMLNSTIIQQNKETFFTFSLSP